MKKLLFIALTLIYFPGFAQDGNFTVYLIGDAGEEQTPGKALELLKDELLSHPNSAVVFLGDNVYPNGLKKGDRNSELHLESQLQILKEFKGQVYFIPGNHDWDAQKRNGLQTLKDQQEYVESYLKGNTTVGNKDLETFLPKDGLPGPSTVMLTPKIRLIILDTQWFLHFHKKNKVGTKKDTKVKFYARLDSLLTYATKNGEEVVIAAHHPLYSNGAHARFKQPLRFLVNCTPLQILGLCGLNRLYSQDLSAPRYRKMRKNILASMYKQSNIVFASGHDHNLQCFKQNGSKYIVSGAGSKLSNLKKRKRFDSVFQDDQSTGFIKLEYVESRYRSSTVFRVGAEPLVVKGL